jgi:hypothetical protein
MNHACYKDFSENGRENASRTKGSCVRVTVGTSMQLSTGLWVKTVDIELLPNSVPKLNWWPVDIRLRGEVKTQQI